MRLQAAGMRPVSNVVDASNYVMLELGKPTHTFDGAAVHGRHDHRPPGRCRGTAGDARPRRARADPGHPDHRRPEGPIGIAGVMGGADSEITDATTEIAIESAIFDPVSIRRTGHRYALRSEASLRFEKGQEFRLARIGADRVAQLTLAWAGGSVAKGRVDTAPAEPEPARLAFRPGRVEQAPGRRSRGGGAASAAAARRHRDGGGAATAPTSRSPSIPSRCRCAAGDEAVLVAMVPTWRRDLAIEADVAEEVARVRGYETTPAHLPDTLMPAYRPSPLKVRDMIRETLAGAGLTEVVTHALVSSADEARLLWPEDDERTRAAGRSGGPGRRRDRGDEPALGPALGPEAASGGEPARRAVPERAPGPLRRRRLRDRQGLRPRGRSSRASGPASRFSCRVPPNRRRGTARPATTISTTRRASSSCSAATWVCPAPSYVPDTRRLPVPPGSRPGGRLGGGRGGRSPAGWRRSTRTCWRMGPARASASSSPSLPAPRWMPAAPARVHVEPIPRFPEVERDLAVIVAEDRTAAEVEATIRASRRRLCCAASACSTSTAARRSAATEKSLAYRLILGAKDRTLTEAEVDAAMAQVRAGLESELGGHLRT